MQLRFERRTRGGRLGLLGRNPRQIEDEILQRVERTRMSEGRLERGQTHIEVLAQRVELALRVDSEVLSDRLR
jgi:hypothetical protein